MRKKYCITFVAVMIISTMLVSCTARPEQEQTTSSATVSEQAATETAAPETAAPAQTVESGEEIVASALKDKIICIDPGHQEKANSGKEPVAPGQDELKAKCSGGATGVKTKTPESRINLEVSLKLRDALEKLGAEVIMTRTDNKVDISNVERAEIANDALADIYIRIHADGSSDSAVNGASVLVPGDRYIKDEELLEKSKKAGKLILDGLSDATGAKSRGVVIRNDLTGFNWCTRPMVLVEMGFLSNEKEDKLLNDETYQDKIVEGIKKGIESFFR